MPFTNRKAWLETQRECADLRKVFTFLTSGASGLLGKCNWLNGTHMLYVAMFNFIHKMNLKSEPKSIVQLYTYINRVNEIFTRSPNACYYISKSNILNSPLCVSLTSTHKFRIRISFQSLTRVTCLVNTFVRALS